jgi:D-tyrosyl-tRNA(Tyr) deacylase
VRVVLQRVARASVTVGGERVAEIGRGYLLLVGVGRGDPADEAERLADRIVGLRLFADEDGKTNRSIVDVAGEVLVVPQFTLYADLSKGRRPSWTGAEDPAIAEQRVEALAAAVGSRGVPMRRGVFGAEMLVELANDGPFTLVLDAAAR